MGPRDMRREMQYGAALEARCYQSEGPVVCGERDVRGLGAFAKCKD